MNLRTCNGRKETQKKTLLYMTHRIKASYPGSPVSCPPSANDFNYHFAIFNISGLEGFQTIIAFTTSVVYFDTVGCICTGLRGRYHTAAIFNMVF